MELWARNWPVILPKFRLPRKFRDLLHAAILRNGTDGFTSPPKEGVLRIFSLEAYPVKKLKLVFETPCICDRLASETDLAAICECLLHVSYTADVFLFICAWDQQPLRILRFLLIHGS